ncbi:hypothetical protein FB567DRAFT_610883 [Paraphoma chrysanthemicola]|uniref:Uncharacterized protein n=1 Tax=Paraphoma chrysanthemicola TaxID=798071 RepID=A0A8K0QX68_9PLEO|nr:hypothetical protein FB567DRAFT_610883 [Paraphoma chrysanthemicola]
MRPCMPRLITATSRPPSTLKAAPSLALVLASPSAQPTPTSPPSRSILESFLQEIPNNQLPQDDKATEQILLTCPQCSFIETRDPGYSEAAPICAKCMRHFKKYEKMTTRRRNELTSFPCFLEEHNALRDRLKMQDEEREGTYSHGSLGRIFEAISGSSKTGDGSI